MEVVRYLLENYREANQAASRCADDLLPEKGETTALHIAADHGYEEVVELLLRHGADVGRRNANGMTAVHLAARQPNEQVAVIVAF